MGSCHLSLKNYNKAKVSLKLAKHFATKHDPENFKFHSSLDKLLKKCEVRGSTADSTSTTGTTRSSEEIPNLMFPSASNKFTVKTGSDEDEEGRFAVASETILTGEKVLSEVPYASCLLPERMGTHCLHCFAKLKAPIACETCANVAFCSKECRKRAEAYHRYECRVLALLLGSGMSVLPRLALRIITQVGFSFQSQSSIVGKGTGDRKLMYICSWLSFRIENSHLFLFEMPREMTFKYRARICMCFIHTSLLVEKSRKINCACYIFVLAGFLTA